MPDAQPEKPSYLRTLGKWALYALAVVALSLVLRWTGVTSVPPPPIPFENKE